MVSFEGLKTSEHTQRILESFSGKIDFVFQPVYTREMTVIGNEALMRPSQMSIKDLIEKSIKENKLHELELVTFFGATIAYRKRNLQTKLAMNSFPSECFTVEEAREYSESFRPIKDKMIIEILEYMTSRSETWQMKKRHAEDYKGISFALDDFGTGCNNLDSVEFFQPRTVKLDRSLITGIDNDKSKQQKVIELEKLFHSQNRLVLAEGIESRGEFDFLLDHNIDMFQGFFLGTPE